MGKSSAEYIRQMVEALQKLDYIKPDEIPNIDLYMDQVTTFMDEHLEKAKRYEEDKILTKTMINNYTKNRLLPPPVKKKYSKEHMLLLIFIYYFKNILSISDIRAIFEPLTDLFAKETNQKLDLEAIYEEVFSYEKEQAEILIKDVIKKYQKAKKAFSDKVEDEKESEFLTSFTFICLLSFDVYIKKMMIEKIIDEQMVAFSNNKKKDS